MTLNERVRERLRDEKAKRKLSERDLAGFSGWSQSKIAQKLSGRTTMTLDELEVLCFAVGIAPTEAVRDRGLEFVAELTPTELRMLELIRHLPRPTLDAFLHLLRVHPELDAETRGATPRRAKYGKRRSE